MDGRTSTGRDTPSSTSATLLSCALEGMSDP